MMVISQRPGVYTQYTITPAAGLAVSRGEALVIAQGVGEQTGKLNSFSSLSSLKSWEDYRAASPCHKAAALLLKQGAAKVHLITAGQNYEAAFEMGKNLERVSVVVTDCPNPALIRKGVEQGELPGGRKARTTYVGGEELDSSLTLAEQLSSGRCCVCYPPMELEGERKGLYTAAAFAARVLALESPAYTLSWMDLEGVSCPVTLTEEDIERLIAGGAIPFACRQGTVECVRAVTTAAKDNGCKNLNTILIIDHVMEYLSENLTLLLKNSRGRTLSLEAIASQAAVLLSNKLDEGLIVQFESPKAAASAEDPAVCLLTVGFQAATVTDIIRLTAAIRV